VGAPELKFQENTPFLDDVGRERTGSCKHCLRPSRKLWRKRANGELGKKKRAGRQIFGEERYFQRESIFIRQTFGSKKKGGEVQRLGGFSVWKKRSQKRNDKE